MKTISYSKRSMSEQISFGDCAFLQISFR